MTGAKRSEWRTTIWWLVAAGVVAVGAVATMRWTAARAHEGALERHRQLHDRVVGTSVSTRFAVGLGDTISLGSDGPAATLLAVTQDNCGSCDRMVRALADVLGDHAKDEIRIWFAGAPPMRHFAAISERGWPVHDAHPVDDAGFRQTFGIEQVPYLALISPGGRIEAATMGFGGSEDLAWLASRLRLPRGGR